MADTKISGLPASTTPLAGTEVLPIVQSGTTKQVSVANLTAGRAITAASAIISDNSANAALRVTQVGAGNAILVEDSANPDATPFVVSAAGLVGIGTLAPSSALDIGSTASGGTFASQIFSANNSAAAKTNYVKIDASIALGSATAEAGGYQLKVLQNNAYKTIIDASGTLYNSTNYLAFGTTNEAMRIASNGTISLGGTTGAESLRVTPVTSSVNYVSVFGSVTGQTPTISPQGSDTNIPLGFSSKGTSGLTFYTNAFGNIQLNIANTASAVNYLQVTGAVTTGAPVISALGSDADIDIRLTPKGTGVLRFGTYTAGILAQAGYITIKDAAGTTRNLLVG
jgi:hypothetical protein